MSESLPQFRARHKFRRLHLSSGSRKDCDLLNYQRFFNAHVRGVSKSHRLQDSELSGTFWTAHEKDLFFRALARHGKSNVAAVANDTGKSLLSCAFYLYTLQSALATRRAEDATSLLSIRDFPAAVEVNDSTLAREEGISHGLVQQDVKKFHSSQHRIGWTLLTRPEVKEVKSMVENMSEDQEDLFFRIAPDLLIFDFTRFTTPDLDLPDHDHDHGHGYEDHDQNFHQIHGENEDHDKDDGSVVGWGIYKSTSEGLYDLLKTRLRDLMTCAMAVAERRTYAEQSPYFKETRFKDVYCVNARDVDSALRILYPRDYSTLPIASRSTTSSTTTTSNSTSASPNSAAHDTGEVVSGANAVEDETMMNDEETDDATVMQEEDELDALLEHHDALIAVEEENEYRTYLNLDLLTVPAALTAKQQSMLGKLLREECRAHYDTSDDYHE